MKERNSKKIKKWEPVRPALHRLSAAQMSSESNRHLPVERPCERLQQEMTVGPHNQRNVDSSPETLINNANRESELDARHFFDHHLRDLQLPESPPLLNDSFEFEEIPLSDALRARKPCKSVAGPKTPQKTCNSSPEQEPLSLAYIKSTRDFTASPSEKEPLFLRCANPRPAASMIASSDMERYSVLSSSKSESPEPRK